MFVFVLQQRRFPEDEHWWDRDPQVRERNRRLEADLDRIITGGSGDPPGNGPAHTLKAWAQVIGIVGIPGVIAFWLVWVGSTQIPGIVRQQEAILFETKQLRERQEQTIELMNTLIRVTQRACSNAAKDDHARQRCFDR